MERRPVLMIVAILVVATLVVVAFVAASCRGGTTIAGNPTPFPTPGTSLTATVSNAAAIEVTISELSANPGLYEGAILRVSGRFQRQPLLVCDADPHPSPATWGLAEEGLTALASGMDRQLRALLPEALTMTVEGRWRRWQGLVGCGKSAQARDFYYLEVGRVLSPSPLTMVTLTPDPNQPPTEIAAIPPVITPTLALTPTLDITEEVTPTLPLTPTETVELPVFPTQAGTTPDFELTPSPTDGNVITPTQLATPTSPLGGTATTITPQGTITPVTPGTPATPGTPGTPTPTVTGTPPTPTASPTLSSSNAEFQGDLYEDLTYWVGIEHLDANQIHSWEMELFNDERTVVQVIAPAPANAVLSVLRDGQVIENRINQMGAGAAESVTINSSAEDGEVFEILVETSDLTASDYSIVMYYDDEFDPRRLIYGFLTSGNQQNNITLPADTEHIWLFTGNAGDTLSFTISPGGTNDDPFPVFIGPNTNEDVDGGEIEDSGNGEDDTLTDFELPTTGLYAIIVGDSNTDNDGITIGFTYDIVITLQ